MAIPTYLKNNPVHGNEVSYSTAFFHKGKIYVLFPVIVNANVNVTESLIP
jgi:hypothetical protein